MNIAADDVAIALTASLLAMLRFFWPHCCWRCCDCFGRIAAGNVVANALTASLLAMLRLVWLLPRLTSGMSEILFARGRVCRSLSHGEHGLRIPSSAYTS